MSKIDTKLIKELRELSGAGMMDCKNALTETDGNIEDAVDWLRKKGFSKASKKSDRITAEGVVAIEVKDNVAIILEVNSETDFVARNEIFQNFVKNIAKVALKSDGTIENLKTLKLESGESVNDALTSLIATIGENITLRRLSKVSGEYLYPYIHNSITEGLGKIGVIVSLEKEAKSASLGKQIAMHIAASKPKSLDITSLDIKEVEKEKEIQRDIAKQSGKADDIIEKMLEGRIKKFYQEVCLVEQSFIVDPDNSIKKVLENNGTTIADYKFFVLGEGIEKQEVDFASEVANTIK